MESSRFFTQKGYELQNQEELSASMEDYLEMIYRMLQESQCVRIHALAKQLHVKPSSASKMVTALKEKGYIEFEHYGYLTATKKGRRQATTCSIAMTSCTASCAGSTSQIMSWNRWKKWNTILIRRRLKI